MIEFIHPDHSVNIDLNLYKCGSMECMPGYAYGPVIRDHYLIHYVLEGRGLFQVNNKTYYLEKNQGFLICPDYITYYKADNKHPWSYLWLGFNGIKAEAYLRSAGLSADNPIFRYDKDNQLSEYISQLITAQEFTKSRDYRQMGLLYLILGMLVEESPGNLKYGREENRKEYYSKSFIEYISKNYSRKISVSEISRHMGLDRSYMGQIFKDCLNTTPQKFLMDFRISRACALMQNEGLSIADIARSTGYEDPFVFSKAFKKVKGMSPKEYRILGSGATSGKL